MADEWFYTADGRSRGPVAAEEMTALVARGIVTGETRVWRAGMADWEPAMAHFDGVPPPLGGSLGPRPALPGGGRDYRRQSGMVDALRQFFRRYADFRGRSNRGEYWWWVLDNLLIGLVLGLLDAAVFGAGPDGGQLFQAVYGLATLIPTLALGVRRLHDIGRSGWWLLLALVPVVGWLVLIWWACQPPEAGPNRWG